MGVAGGGEADGEERRGGQYDLTSSRQPVAHDSRVDRPSTELDRAIGEEANYAGTSFVAPPEK